MAGLDSMEVPGTGLAVAQQKRKLRYSKLIAEAIRSLGERRGSSRQSIVRYIANNHLVNKASRTRINSMLKKMVARRDLIQTHGKGANGSFKMNKNIVPFVSAGGRKKRRKKRRGKKSKKGKKRSGRKGRRGKRRRRRKKGKKGKKRGRGRRGRRGKKRSKGKKGGKKARAGGSKRRSKPVTPLKMCMAPGI